MDKDVNQLAFLDWVSDWVLTCSPDGAIRAFSQPARSVLGGGIVPRSAFEELALPGFRTRLGKLLDGRTTSAEDVEFQLKDGRQLSLELRFHPHPEGGGTLTARDVTQQRQLEAQLQQTQKREALGVLAGGIAHDFNNLLTGILGYAELLRLEAPAGERLHDALTVIHTAADHASRLTSQLLRFARHEQQIQSAVNVHSVVAEVIGLLSRTLDKSIRIETSLQASNPQALGESGQIHQILLNLALNARDAMPHGGCLTFRTALHEPSPEVGLAAVPHLVVEISDTGVGVPPELMPRIFDPFFTTKTGSGSGMGLAMVSAIVKKHKGVVSVSSVVGQGSTFTIYLPLADEASQGSLPSAAPTVRRGQGTVLLLDDEEIVRKVGARMLEGLGYRVLSFSNGRDAIDYYAAHTGDIDAIMLDMVMPLINGRDCFKRFRDIAPSVPVVLTSGYNRDAAVEDILSFGQTAFIQKPYQLAALADVLANLLPGPNNPATDSASPDQAPYAFDTCPRRN